MSADHRKIRVWMHCASLGEFEQGRPVIEGLRQNYPEISIIVTFFSPSGFEVRKNYEGADHIFYLPADSASNARRFLDIVRPTLVLWIKYEYWYYYLRQIHKMQIPLLLISANFIPSQAFFQWYGSLHRKMLDFFSGIFVQSESSRILLTSINVVKKVEIGGDTRFDRVMDIAGQFEEIESIARFCGQSQVVVSGSTWEEDEEMLDHYANTHQGIRFIIAPHEIGEERIRKIQELFKHSVTYSTYINESEMREPAGETNVLIIDNIGLLSRLYKYATIAYVGGGFGEDGVHNILEAAVFGRPVIYGPVYEKFLEAAELVECGGGISIGSALELERLLNKLLKDKSAYNTAAQASRNYVRENIGARERILKFIEDNHLV
ncbi:MAG: glycosyltransferase N-terminal domain-containing protein [Chitinophagaceae bacterium]